MNLLNRQQFFEAFWEDCLRITAKKGRDYNPDDIPLMDVLNTATETHLTITQVLWVYYAKHATAIRKYFNQNQALESEPILGRLMDAANYLGMMAYYDTHRNALHAAWRDHWVKQRCACEKRDIMILYLCQRCETLLWLDTLELNKPSAPI